MDEHQDRHQNRDDSGDADRAAAAVAEVITRPTVWRRFMHATVSLPILVAVALAGPCLSVLLAVSFEPGTSWVAHMLTVAGNGWLGPLLILATVAFAQTRNEKRVMRAASVIISVMAARVRAYREQGMPAPETTAAIDVADSLAQRKPALLIGRWGLDGVAWHRSLPSDTSFPPLPRSIVKAARKVDDITGQS